jgi:SAM-dependent methyltransferase
MAIKEKNKSLDCRQDAIWTYYQNERAGDFQGARPRMAHIIYTIRGKKRKSDIRLLNIGAGNGDFEKMAASQGWDIYSADPDEGTVNRLKLMGIKAARMHIEEMVFQDKQFDFVVASEVLEHLSVEQFNLGLAEVKRILKPGGWFIGTVPHREDLQQNYVFCPHCNSVFHRWGHMRSFDLKSLATDLNCFFSNVRVKRTAFVALRGKGLRGLIKGCLRIALAKIGEEIAVPSILFIAQKEISKIMA